MYVNNAYFGGPNVYKWGLLWAIWRSRVMGLVMACYVISSTVLSKSTAHPSIEDL